jgi:hypothetical protein
VRPALSIYQKKPCRKPKATPAPKQATLRYDFATSQDQKSIQAHLGFLIFHTISQWIATHATKQTKFLCARTCSAKYNRTNNNFKNNNSH